MKVFTVSFLDPVGVHSAVLFLCLYADSIVQGFLVKEQPFLFETKPYPMLVPGSSAHYGHCEWDSTRTLDDSDSTLNSSKLLPVVCSSTDTGIGTDTWTGTDMGLVAHTRNEKPTSRRNFLEWGLASAVAASAVALQMINLHPSTKIVTSGSIQKLVIVEDPIQWIDDFCDRRFLHAVVASDYRFVYRGIQDTGIRTGSSTTSTLSFLHYNETPDLLSPETYNSPEALSHFQQLETLMKRDDVRPSNGHLATTSAKDAAAWGDGVASIWPVVGAHYAWYQSGGLFYPRQSDGLAYRSNIVVDGIDCDQGSLDDALTQAKPVEIMIAAPSFLAVPQSMDNLLRRRLRTSFML